MKIYTKQGDKGTTAVYTTTVTRVDKDDLLLECYGNLDELNSYIGLVASQYTTNKNTGLSSFLQSIQQDIFAIGFALSDSDKLEASSVEKLEHQIDSLLESVSPQTSFILPGGCELSAHIHVARTIARRSERSLVSVSKAHNVNEIALAYVNRLSDFLFVLARYENKQQGTPDIKV